MATLSGPKGASGEEMRGGDVERGKEDPSEGQGQDRQNSNGQDLETEGE